MAEPRHLVAVPDALEQELTPLYREALGAGGRRDWKAAFEGFARAYARLLEEQRPGKRFHKGMQLHNMGLAQLYADNIQDSLRYTLLAFLEDVQSKADERQEPGLELQAPAAHNLLFVYAVPGPVVAGLAESVRQLVIRDDAFFPDPSDLAKAVGADSFRIERGRPTRPASEIERVRRVTASLSDAGFRVQQDAAVAGLRVDLVVPGQRGLLVVEVLSVEPEHPGVSIEARMDRLHRITAAVPNARVVGVVEDRWAEILANNTGIVAERDIVRLAHSAVGGPGPALAGAIEPASKPRIFAAMPFSAAYEDTFYVAILTAARTVGAVAVRVDHNPRSGDVLERIKDSINSAALVVADVSEARPSVLHEYGFAEALGRPVVAITSTGAGTVPFNVSHNDTMEYEKGRTDDLRKRLTTRFRAELRRSGHLPMKAAARGKARR